MRPMRHRGPYEKGRHMRPFNLSKKGGTCGPEAPTGDAQEAISNDMTRFDSRQLGTPKFMRSSVCEVAFREVARIPKDKAAGD